jgi:hypothetical protein
VRAALAALSLLLVAAGAAVAGAPGPPPSPPQAGTRAPDIALGDQHGKAFRLGESLRQRRFVVVAFYIKAFTDG